ncbi:cobalamin biosynthesis protein [Janthinobacterium fluminis]|uniref:Cobalamin biosynthesis protein n=1 Tax=Janthinobacterium fluminis TaxID=2987524 RepID=A0ABT5JXK9_9BURK|nr:cobalamin biosynthesis protein [Janthinobacterium fluminis]MDC8756776.1 cobalamin biosynthesis protein [Janthinobacterium fluminis]
MSEAPLGIWLVRAEGEELAASLQARLGGEIHRPWLNPGAAQKAQFAAAYRRHAQWVMVAASGIAVRFLDGLAQDKHSDPAVVVLDEAGRFAVSLLAGHEGGGNELAYRVAAVVGAVPVVTTATEALKPLVLGVGCRKGVPAGRIEAAVLHALGRRRIDEVREVATVDLKANEPGLLEFCRSHGLPLRVFARATLAARPWVGKPSDWVMQNVGLNGVCEPCALVACPRGTLLVPKTSLDGVAVAVVQDKWMEI